MCYLDIQNIVIIIFKCFNDSLIVLKKQFNVIKYKLQFSFIYRKVNKHLKSNKSSFSTKIQFEIIRYSVIYSIQITISYFFNKAKKKERKTNKSILILHESHFTNIYIKHACHAHQLNDSRAHRTWLIYYIKKLNVHIFITNASIL